MAKIFKQFLTEDWIIVFVGMVILSLAVIFPSLIPLMPKEISSKEELFSAVNIFLFVLLVTYLTAGILTISKYLDRRSEGVKFFKLLKEELKGIFISLFFIFIISFLAQVTAALPAIKKTGFESVFFAVIYGLLINNLFDIPRWLKRAVNSEFYIKIGIICLGSTIIFGEMMKSGAYGLAQSLIIVFSVWYFCFWLSKKMKVDKEMGTMLSSAVSICGVSAAIATCGVIKGDNKKLSYVVSLVLIVAVPMMYIIPWFSNLLHLSPEVAGAWIGGTIDTTGAVAAAGSLIEDPMAAKTAIIVKSSQNVLLGLAAFFISLMWAYQGKNQDERPRLGVIWQRFPKFVLGMIIASLIFSFILAPEVAKSVGKITKSLQNTLFSIAFVCIGLETKFKEIFSRENRKPLSVFLIAQSFNILITLGVAYLIFGIIKPLISML